MQYYEVLSIPALPAKKVGFTIMCWVELSSRNKVNPLLSLIDNNQDLLELIYHYNEPVKAQKRSSLESLN